MKLKTEILKPNEETLLTSICKNAHFDKFYLAGGTALALQFGHRKSYDLDFFSPQEFSSSLTAHLKPSETLSLHDNSIELIVDGIKLFFFFFAFPLKYTLIQIDGIRLAHPVDIGLMKLLALQGRTTKKDIIDLYTIHQEVMPLSELLNLFESHYPKESFNSYKSLKALLDQDELKTSPLPVMLNNYSWDNANRTVAEEITTHIKQLVDFDSSS